VAFQTTESDELLRQAGADWIVKDASAVRVAAGNSTRDISLVLRTA